MKPLILLHGAIGAKDQLEPLRSLLQDKYEIHTLNFAGHGGEASGDDDFTMPLFTDNVLRYMEQKNLNKASVFGYSMGGYVGMYMARHYPEKIDKVITLATKYHWDETTAAKEVQMLNPDKIEQKIPAFAAALQKRHAPNDWKVLLSKTAGMMTALGRENTLKSDDYAAIATPALILLGDRDKMVSLEENVTVYRALPNAQMGMLPATHHPIEQVNLPQLSFMIQEFLQ